MSSLVAVLRRYVEEYTNGHDTSVVPEIIDDGYRFAMSGQTIGYDDYLAMVGGAFDRFPDIELVVHDLFTNGDRLAMRFSEHASSSRHGGRRAVWPGISLYRWNGADRLTECLVEQDFHGRRRQLVTGRPNPLEPAHPDPWSVSPATADRNVEAVVRRWLTRTDVPLVEETHRDGTVAAAGPLPIDVQSVVIDDLFSAGRRAAFRIRWEGPYRGGLLQEPDPPAGTPAWLHATGMASVTDEGSVVDSHLVTDRFGLFSRLAS